MYKIIVIKIDKIQKYIYQSMDDKKFSWQNDSKSLQTIISASNSISDNILEKIENKFKRDIEKKYLWISGKVIFSVFDSINIENKLNELFEEIYIEFMGVITLNYTFFTLENENSENIDDKNIIDKAYEKLDESKQNNEIIFTHRKLLFKFTEGKEENKEKTKNEDDYDIFAKNLGNLGEFGNDITKIEYSDNAEQNKSRKIAVVKADINNMQQIFQASKNYTDFNTLSEILKEHVSLKSLKDSIKSYTKFELKGKILPFYAVGDDIFFVTRIDSVLHSIVILGKLIGKINEKIKEAIPDNPLELTISVGVTFTDNHMPIRYYREVVEKELSLAKKYTKELKASQISLGASICGNYFSLYKKSMGRGESDGLKKFMKEIDELKFLKSKEIFSNTFLNQILHTIEGKERKVQMRLLLYFLIPDINKNVNNSYDLFFKHYFLSQLVEDKKGTYQERLFDYKKIEELFIKKLKLILLLIDDRFVSNIDKNHFKFKHIIRTDGYEEQLKSIESVMFTKPLNYIINQIEEENIEISRMFIKKIQQKIDTNSEKSTEKDQLKTYKKTVTVYSKANLNSSILYRIKKLFIEKQEGKITRIIENYLKLNDLKHKYEDKDKECDNTLDIKYDNTLDIDKLKKEINNKFINYDGDTAWIDYLILFYIYDEQRIKRNECRDYLGKFIEEIRIYEK